MELSGTILAGPEYEPTEGRVVLDDGEIAAVEESPTDSTDIVCPAFVNAHTHLGDSIAKEAGRGLSLDDLVAPPDGLKHRLLADASRGDLVASMRRSLRFMRSGGTGAFVEFREGGTEGVAALESALEPLDLEASVMGRGDAAVLDAADGYGASGARDGEFSTERAAARRRDKPFGIHAGERDAADVNPALDLDPDFLVHMVHAEPRHLERVEDRGVPIAVCPRSNLVTGVGVPPIAELLKRTTVALGTDNVMLNSPSMFREMAFVSKLCDVSAPEVLRMATAGGAELAGLNCGVIEPGRAARMVVLDGDSDNLCGSHDPVRAVVRRAGVNDVTDVVLR
ncbi:amidohydrolase domain protein [Natronomonas moolapensis 8.8.11]|uniref:Amidohydrolase domain protein n=1 Tax=Natronomonas moolapensis (strain DSM 18674 / CECT 7526 / JCM 14361 / 8.8.11) TaxID=268739 RepID=M1XLA5_NATM8|nr:amidohydrolase family protein [Natronomonas moolapensis]CCQ37369.1 amidohydrolase domain protein [Natronomonas moolapensis 8.8.11]